MPKDEKTDLEKELDERLALTLLNMNSDPAYKELIEKVTNIADIDSLPEAEREELKNRALNIVKNALRKTEEQIRK